MEKKDSLVKSSFVLLVMFNIFNLLNFLFQIFVAHNLNVEVYGIFTALFSMVYIYAIFAESVQLVVAKETAKSKSIEQTGRIYGSAMRGSLIFALLIFAVYGIIFAFSSSTLKIPLSLILLNGIVVFLALSAPVIRGVLQGQKRFFELGKNMIAEGLAKLIFCILFLLIGWGIYGVFGALLVSMIIPILYGRLSQISDIVKARNIGKGKLPISEVVPLNVIVIMACIMLFFMLDVVLARAVLNPTLAGYYSIASTIAKIAFIGTQPISKALISHVAPLKNDKEVKEKFKRSALLLLSLLFAGTIIASLLSNFVVSIFAGSDKILAATILPILLIAVSILSVSNLILFYKIATNKVKFFWVLPIFVLVLIAILIVFPSTLLGFAISYLAATIIFLIASLLVIR